jgi:hypothetical protein
LQQSIPIADDRLQSVTFQTDLDPGPFSRHPDGENGGVQE